ncbi:hypothetical protein [Moraxella cuniculi]|uniref:Uncharacterized protein n=1 Tax=Moraxella cuniculi TaxID=34061 RepID=A0A3S4R5U2_9GAMM|nr:hypothetical protein [Moraxella cuniculi]VEG13496.1 Uncharacterised protein [Moraxella cuniculi]
MKRICQMMIFVACAATVLGCNSLKPTASVMVGTTLNQPQSTR